MSIIKKIGIKMAWNYCQSLQALEIEREIWNKEPIMSEEEHKMFLDGVIHLSQEPDSRSTAWYLKLIFMYITSKPVVTMCRIYYNLRMKALRLWW